MLHYLSVTQKQWNVRLRVTEVTVAEKELQA